MGYRVAVGSYLLYIDRCERSEGAVVEEEEGDGMLWWRWRIWALSETAASAPLAKKDAQSLR